MKKRIISVLAVLSLCLLVLPAALTAGTQAADGGGTLTLGTLSKSIAAGDRVADSAGTYSYDGSTHTLTLNNFKYSGDWKNLPSGTTNLSGATCAIFLQSSIPDLKVELVGENEFIDTNARYIKVSESSTTNPMSVGIRTENGCSITFTGTGSLTIKTSSYPMTINGSASIEGGARLNTTSQMDGVRITQNLTVKTGSKLTARCDPSNATYRQAWHAVNVNGTMTVEQGAEVDAESKGCTNSSMHPSDPSGLYVGTLNVSGKVRAVSSGENGYADGCKGYGIRANNVNVNDGGEVTALSTGRGKNGVTAQEAILASDNLTVLAGGYIYAHTDNSAYSAIRCGALGISNEQKNHDVAVITQPWRGIYQNGRICTSSSTYAATVEISGLSRSTLYFSSVSGLPVYSYLETTQEDQRTWYSTSTGFQLAHGEASGNGLRGTSYQLLRDIVVQNGSHTIVLGNIVRTGLTGPYITVKSGATLTLKLTDANSILAGSSSDPIIKVESGAKLNIVNAAGNIYPSLSVLNSSGPAISGGGTVNVTDCILYARGGSSSAGISTPLTIEEGGCVDVDLMTGKLTMNGGSLTGQLIQNVTYSGTGGNLQLTNAEPPAVKGENGTPLYKVELTLYDTKGNLKVARRSALLRTSAGDTTGTARTYLMVTQVKHSTNLSTEAKAKGIPVLIPESDSDATNSTLTLYLPENRMVTQANVGGVTYWASANPELQIIAKSDNSATGTLFVTGHLLMSGTMAFRQFTYVSIGEGGTSGIGRQACPDYRDGGTYWIDYDEEYGITLKTPEGFGYVAGYDMLILSGQHEVMLDTLRMMPTNYSCAEVRISNLLGGDGHLTLNLINGTSNEFRTENGKPVFDLPGGLTIKSTDTTGTLALNGTTRAFGNTSADSSSLTILDSIVVNQCADRTTPTALASLTVKNSTVIGLGVIDCTHITIDGGSVDFEPTGKVYNSAGQELTRQEFTFTGVTGQTKVTGLDISGMPEGSSFDSGNIYTDGSGKITLWLPEGATVVSAALGEGENQETYYPVPDGNGGMKLSTVEPPSFVAPTEDTVLTLSDGEAFTLTVTAAGAPAPTYQWEVFDGQNWTIINGETDASCTGTMTRALHGTQYRCRAVNTYGGEDHEAVSPVFTLLYVPAVTGQPEDVAVLADGEAIFRVTLEALEGAEPAYQWQIKDGESWNDLPGETGSTLTISSARTAAEYRCRVTFTYADYNNTQAERFTGTASLTVVDIPVFSAQPGDVTLRAGETAEFTAAASGNHSITYQWQVKKTVGGDFEDIDSKTSDTLRVDATAAMSGWLYRCAASNTFGDVTSTAYSDPALLTVVGAPVITAQPQDSSVYLGYQGWFSVTAEGNQALRYQWQVKKSEKGDFEDIPGAVSDSYTTAGVSPAMKGWQYRCVVTNYLGSLSVQTVSEPAELNTLVMIPGAKQYTVSASWGAHGSLRLSRSSAAEGETVIVTVTPEDGYRLDRLTAAGENGSAIALTAAGSGTYTFVMPASNVTVSASFTDETADSAFDDVPDGSYYSDAVKWAAENGITGGVGGGLFGPDRLCNRAQIVTFLWRAAGSPEPQNTGSFTDVPADAYYAKAVAWAVEQSITSGTGDGRFSPDAVCTRAQAVTFLWRSLGRPVVNYAMRFTDVPAETYYTEAVRWAVSTGVTNGTGTDVFSPESSCTRAQIVTFLYRAAK